MSARYQIIEGQGYDIGEMASNPLSNSIGKKGDQNTKKIN
jgi:hypothetical protein